MRRDAILRFVAVALVLAVLCVLAAHLR
jgi:hypothetical protein